MKSLFTISALFAVGLVGCGGGGSSSTEACSATTDSACSALAIAATGTGSSSSTATSATADGTDIVLGDWPSTMLQTGFNTSAYWLQDGVWGPGALTRGTYTGVDGTQYQQSMGVSPTMGANGEVAGRITWAWPTGTNEVKSYMAFLAGNKPGWGNSWTKPGGYDVRLLDGSNSQIYPSGKTPGTIFPMQLPIASLKSSAAYKHNAAPTGHGHLSYDIWLQSTPEQSQGFNAKGEITHEIMIPLDYWGNYGAHGSRNPAWYSHDATIDGRLWHIYFVRNFPSQAAGTGWTFVVFEPDQPGIQPASLDVAAFINYLTTQKDKNGAPWAQGNEYAVSVELGVEPFDGKGDITMKNFRVWK